MIKRPGGRCYKLLTTLYTQNQIFQNKKIQQLR